MVLTFECFLSPDRRNDGTEEDKKEEEEDEEGEHINVSSPSLYNKPC